MIQRMALLLFAVLTAALASVEALTLVQDHEPAAVIVLPDSPAPSQTLAAEELQRYVERISRAKLPIVTASKLPGDDARVRVHVGNSPRVAELGVKIAELPREGFVIKTVGNNLVLAGEDGTASDKATDPFHPYVRTGTLFAVYAFLEDELGVRWLWPGETGEVVPKQSTIKVGSLDRKEHPLLFKRQLRPTLDPRWIKAHKEEVSFIPAEVLEKLSRDEAVWLKRMRMGRGQQVNYGHAFTTWWQRYGQEHPEYFALQPNGQRGPHHPRAADTVKMCVSEPKLWDKLIEDFVAAHKLNPELVRSVNGCENDGSGGFCTCERCRGWDVPSRVDKGKDGKEYVVLSDRYCKFWNALGERLAKIAPEAWVTGYAYSRYRLAPVETRLRDNILTGFVGFGYPSTPEARQATREDWLAWAKAGTKLFLRPNALLAGHGMPYVYTRALAEDFVFCGQNGMRATDFDSLTGFWATTGPTYYVLAKLHWTPSLNVAKLLDDYYSHFGPAAKDVQAYFDFWEGWTLRFADLKVRDRIYELSPTSGARGFVKVLPEVYREEDFGAGRPFLERAKAAAEKGTPEHRQRVEHLRLGFEHARLTVRALAAASGTSAWKSTDVSEILQAARDLVAFRKRIAALNVTNVAWLTYNEIR
ncbi:MAG: DUF4838 domain-containing protein, partial [Planctomycetes bacterium]|nr:DUF4838 domain-containing protein [Planctomycetota bacterium]